MIEGRDRPARTDLSTDGLAPDEAAARLLRDGPNSLPAPRGRPVWRQGLTHLTHFFAAMLWVAAGLAFIARLPELGIAIIVVVLVNACFASIQEFRSEHAAARIRDLLPRRARVLRGGCVVELDAIEVVRDDVLLLQGGDRVPADLRVLEAHSASIDESVLTGESIPSPVEPGHRLYSGTFLTEGEVTGIAAATGSSTRLAQIARLTRGVTRPTPPLALDLKRVVQTIALIAMAVGIVFFVLSLALGTAPAEGFVLAIGVTVALVPEAMLPTVTLSLAIGAQRMARRHALVRRLEAVETLGSTTFICTDKTGTLTRNQMAVVEVWTPSGSARITGEGYAPVGEIRVEASARGAVEAVALAAARCSIGMVMERDGAWVAQGDPMEAAIDALARRLQVDLRSDRTLRPDARRFPFDPRRRRMSVVAGSELLVKGAPDSVLPLCGDIGHASSVLEVLTKRGLRVLAVASRQLPVSPTGEVDALERDLSLLGLLGFEDPPRAHAALALDACRRAGMRVAMVTGDHPDTALAIARETGLARADERVLLGSDLPQEEGPLGSAVDHDGIVIARVTPEDKLRIARALKARDHVVAMTGDGVNDGPALQEADIGIAMGLSGTDVAREAADLVLLDDDFATIVDAIAQGRATFSNVRRFLTYHLTDNVAELTPFLVWALSGGRFPLALGVLQILALDIGTDTLSATALGAEAPSENVLRGPPMRERLLNARVVRRAFGVLGPTEAILGMGAFGLSLIALGWWPGEPMPASHDLAVASGATFMTVVIAQTANAFVCRSSTIWPGALGWFTNRLLIVGAVIELMISAGFIFVPMVAQALGHAPPSVVGWLVALMAAPLLVLVDALHKRRLRAGPANPHLVEGSGALSGHPK